MAISPRFLEPSEDIVIIARSETAERSSGAAVLYHVAILFLLNYGMALVLYTIKDIPLFVDSAWLDAMASGLLLFLISGTLPFVIAAIARLRGRSGRWAIQAHYLLTILIGISLSIGAYMAVVGHP